MKREFRSGQHVKKAVNNFLQTECRQQSMFEANQKR